MRAINTFCVEDMAVCWQMREILADFIHFHLAIVTLSMVDDEASNDLHVSLFGTTAMMSETRNFADLFE